MSKFSRLSRLIVETDSPIAKRVLLLAFSAAFLVYVASANSSRVIVSPWLVGEWLVSYSGGFNRRGLAGSVVLALSDLTVGPAITSATAASRLSIREKSQSPARSALPPHACSAASA